MPTPGKGTLAQRLGRGTPLPPQLKAQWEKSLNRDLSGVRIHTDDAAAEAADSVNARAAAIGEDIVFARGEYDPDHPASQQLLAHEVAHTAQQRDADPEAAYASYELATTTPGDAAERDADTAATAMMLGTPAQVSAQPVAIARKTRSESVRPVVREAPVEAPAPAVEADAAVEVPADAPAAAKDAKAPDAKTGDVDLSAERVGIETVEGPDQPIAEHNTAAAQQEIAAQGEAMPKDGGAEDLAAGGVPGATAGAAPAATGPAGEVSPELEASIETAQAETRQAVAQAEADSTAYKTEMTERRDAFDAEQRAMTVEQLKTMSPADKRSTLTDMGYDAKAVKKMKDAELDGVITGRIDTEQRQTRIMGMTPDELAKLSPERKIQHLVDLGIDKGDLDKIGPARAAKAFDDIMALAHVQGQHTVKIKVKGGLLGKSWVVSVNCDAEGNSDISAKKEGGFLSKLWGWIKAALPIILTVLAPLTAGASLIALAVYQAATAIASGDWLGAVVAGATAIVGVGAFMAAKGALGAASTFSKLAQVASKVKSVAQAAQAAMTAAKAKNAGSLLGALASGAAAFAKFSATSADKLAQTMNRWSDKLKQWSGIIGGGETVVRGIKGGDPIAAVGGALDSVTAAVGPTSGATKNLAKASAITGYVAAGKQALAGKPPDYGAVAEAALGIAGTLKSNQQLENAAKLTGAANRLKNAWLNRASDPGALATAAFEVAEAIQIARYNSTHPEEKDEDGNVKPDEERAAYVARYERAGRIIGAAARAVTAVSAKPRPNYAAAIAAGNDLIAEFSTNRKLKESLTLTSAMAAWTQAVNSGNEAQIQAAGIAFGESINSLRADIVEERKAAKQGATAGLPAGAGAGAAAALDDEADDFAEFEADGSDKAKDGDGKDGDQQGQQGQAKDDKSWTPEAMTTPVATVTSLDGPTPRTAFSFNGIKADAELWIATYSDGSTVRIFAPKAPTPGYHNHTVEEVASAAGFMPKSARAQIARIQLNPVVNPDDAHWAAEYKVPDFHSYMTAGAGGVVTIYPDKVTTPNQDDTAQRNALVHETGHTWSYRTWGIDTTKGKWLDWKKAMTADGQSVSGYATSSIVEDVAETIRVYVSTKGTPRYATYEAKVPNRFAMLKREYDK